MSTERLTNHPEEAAVRAPLELYMRGHAEDNADHMRAAFMPTARLESVREGPLTSWDVDFYCQRFKNQPAADEATRRRVNRHAQTGEHRDPESRGDQECDGDGEPGRFPEPVEADGPAAAGLGLFRPCCHGPNKNWCQSV